MRLRQGSCRAADWCIGHSVVLMLLLFTGAECAPAQAQASDATAPVVRSSVSIPRVSRAPRIDDFVSGTPREAEARLDVFRQYRPGDGAPGSQETAAYLSFDDRNLYVVFVCKDDPARVRAHMARREDIGQDEQVALYIDTFHDRQRSYVFSANPLGIQLDGIFTEGQGYDFSFDTLWHSQGRLTPDGYIVWMAIPFKSLRFSDAAPQQWGIALNRVIIRTNEVLFWPYLTTRVQNFVPQFATLEGLEDISPGRNLQFIPYGIYTHSRFLDPAIPARRTDNDFRGGLDAKIVLRDAFTLDVALNPDFSQVESDEPQVLVNQRFEVFFPEKRPFFIENSGFFHTPINLFFSRRIADPRFGVRLTGRAGDWTLAGLLMDDRAPGELQPAGSPLANERAGIGVVRVRREFNGRAHFGGLVTSRDFGPSSNRVFSVDTRIQLDRNWVLEGQMMRSYTRNLDGSRVSGPAYWAELLHIGRHFSYGGHYSDRSPDFRSELGFIPRVDIRTMQHFAAYFWRPDGRRLVQFGPSALAIVNWNRQNQVQDWISTLAFQTTFTGQTTLEVGRTEAFELFQGVGFRKHSTRADFGTQWLKWLGFRVTYDGGTRINFFPSSGPPFLSTFSNVTAGFTYRPAPKLRFDQTYLYSRLGTREGSTPAGFSPGMGIFNNHILRSKLNYQFTRELSLRLILDYNAVLPNEDLVSLTRAKRLNADVLVTYLLNPGTALYVGYTDRYENLRLDPLAPGGLARTTGPGNSTGRQFFVKLSYLLRY